MFGDFRQHFNAYLDRVNETSAWRFLRSEWHCWAVTGWHTLMPLPEATRSSWGPWWRDEWVVLSLLTS